MSIAELSRIDRTIEIQASPERVWCALTNAEELDVVPGDNRRRSRARPWVWMTSVHPDHAGQRFRVEIAELTPPRRVVRQWHPGEVDPAVDYSREPQTTVTFTLEPSGRGTQLSVSETGFDEISLARRAKVYADNSRGWTDVLVWLQKYVEAAG